MKAVLLDAETLGDDIDLSPIESVVSSLRVFNSTSADQLPLHIGDAELVLTNKVNITADVMSRLKGILVLATGTNNIDLEAAKALGIPVLNVKNYGTQSVAQHAMMLMLSLAARLPCYQRDVANGLWQQSSSFCLMHHKTDGLAGKKLVIVGSGALGSELARLAEAFGMSVCFSARPGDPEDSRPAFENLLREADVLSFHCPLTEQTHHLLNAQNLQTIKRGCLVVNCARGGIIDEVATLEALKRGQIGGLAVDVLPLEPPEPAHPIIAALDEGLNLMVTPHNAWISPEARQNIINLTAQNIQYLTK